MQLVADVAARIAGAADADDALAGTTRLLEERLGVPLRATGDGRLAEPEGADARTRQTLELANGLLVEGPRLRRTARLAALGQLSAGLAHELSNTLTAIGLHTAAIEADIDPVSRAAGEVRELHHLAETSSELVRRVLAIARGSTPPQARRDLVAVLREAEERLARTAGPQTALTLALPDRPCVVGLSRGGAEHLVLNLIANAREAMPGGGAVTVEVTCDGDVARLSVGDTGHGMPEHVRRRVLEPFFTTRAPDGGTGLGLALVAEIAAHAGGTVEVESAEGDGTTVHVTLPLAGD
jgi:signal transduction histidine kinase